MNWCILAPLAVQWLREGQPLEGVSGAAAPGSPCRFAASQAVGGFNRYREGSFWSERDPSATDSSQSRQDPGKEETKLVLVENQQEAAGR